jgi:glycosyltransferase involved in cell wall biosynthesis
MIGISTEVRKRILKYYSRTSPVVFPPVTLMKASIRNTHKKNYYLLVSRLVKYKKVDLAIKAFNALNQQLIIVGTGREEKRLKRMAKKNIRFLNSVTDRELVTLYSNAKALIFPQQEDFGLVAVEAMSLGTPVIAYRRGGAIDTITEGVTGVFFNKQTSESLIEAVKSFDATQFNDDILKRSAKKFSKERFLTEFATILKQHT